MGQYYIVANLSKRQCLMAHDFGEGLKLMEFGCGGCGVSTALILLLSNGNGQGGGDLHTQDEEVVGSWAGDRIVVAGDYGEQGKFLSPEILAEYADKRPDEYADLDGQTPTLYEVAGNLFENICEKIIPIMCEDAYVREVLMYRFNKFGNTHRVLNESLKKKYPDSWKAVQKRIKEDQLQ